MAFTELSTAYMQAVNKDFQPFLIMLLKVEIKIMKNLQW